MGDGWWKVYGIDLSKLVQADPGALYRVEVSFRPEYALYACEEKSFVKNNIGIIVFITGGKPYITGVSETIPVTPLIMRKVVFYKLISLLQI